MTAIAGLIHKGKVYIGGDAAGVEAYSLQRRKDPKVFVVRDFVIGYTSSFRMGQLLRFHLNPAKPTEKQDPFEYMVCSFVPAVRTTLKDNGYLRVDSNVETGGTFMVGWRGELYCIYSDLQVAQVQEPYAACGCGEGSVLGSLHATTTIRSAIAPKRRIELALQAAEAFSAAVRGPFTVLSQ